VDALTTAIADIASAEVSIVRAGSTEYLRCTTDNSPGFVVLKVIALATIILAPTTSVRPAAVSHSVLKPVIAATVARNTTDTIRAFAREALAFAGHFITTRAAIDEVLFTSPFLIADPHALPEDDTGVFVRACQLSRLERAFDSIELFVPHLLLVRAS
jgi:hypothetical protein